MVDCSPLLDRLVGAIDADLTLDEYSVRYDNIIADVVKQYAGDSGPVLTGVQFWTLSEFIRKGRIEHLKFYWDWNAPSFLLDKYLLMAVNTASKGKPAVLEWFVSRDMEFSDTTKGMPTFRYHEFVCFPTTTWWEFFDMASEKCLPLEIFQLLYGAVFVMLGEMHDREDNLSHLGADVRGWVDNLQDATAADADAAAATTTTLIDTGDDDDA